MKTARLMIPLCMAFLSGCVSFGVECRNEKTNAWMRARRFGWGISARQAQALADMKTKVCP